jgi:hypothetical protein
LRFDEQFGRPENKKTCNSFEFAGFLLFDIDTGRGGGIRTPGTRKGSPVFKTGAINRSTTPLFYPPSLRPGRVCGFPF